MKMSMCQSRSQHPFIKRPLAVIGAALLLWMYAGSCQAGEDTILRLGQYSLAASSAMDFYSGARLNQNRFHETNIAGNNRVAQVAIMGGTTAFLYWGSGRIWHEGGKAKKVLAVAILAGGTAAHSWAASHNWRLK